MAKLGDSCDKCGNIINKYPIYGNTCCSCNYRRFVENQDLKKKIDAFYQRRIEEGCDVTDKDQLLSSLLDVIEKMDERDIEAIDYIINNVKERW